MSAIPLRRESAGEGFGRTAAKGAPIRQDLRIIGEMVEPGARVLDVGCGDGALLEYLTRERQAIGRGIELSQTGVNACVRRGLSAVQGDADTDLKDYPSDAFDYVILSQTLQATRNPRAVLDHLVRIGRKAVVSVPNFGHWRVRLHLLTHGTMPVVSSLPEPWYETPNIHLCTLKDLRGLCALADIRIIESLALDGQGRVKRMAPGLGNLLAEQGLFVLSRTPG